MCAQNKNIVSVGSAFDSIDLEQQNTIWNGQEYVKYKKIIVHLNQK